MTPKPFAYSLYGLYCLTYAAFIYTSYTYYEGGSDVSLSDSVVWISTLLIPLVASLIPWAILLLIKRESASKGYSWAVIVVSGVGSVLHSFAAYLAWWSSTQ